MANQVIQSEPDNIKNLYRRGIARKWRKDYDGAIDDLERVKKLDPEMEG
jgi:tetratricopeptide (TPR) repeat protein